MTTTTALPDVVLALLHADGCTVRFVAEKVGCGIRDARALLLAAGARPVSNKYRIGSRVNAFTADRACVSAPLTGADFQDRGLR